MYTLMKYIFVIHLFDVVYVNTLLYKLGQTYDSFTLDKIRALVFYYQKKAPCSLVLLYHLTIYDVPCPLMISI